MREHFRLFHERQFHHRGQRYKNGIIEAWQKAGVARAPVACQTLFKSSSNRRYFPVQAPELDSVSASESVLSDISHGPASSADGSDELHAGASSLTQAAHLAPAPAQHTQNQLQREASPISEQYRWIQFTEWGRYLAEYPLKAAARLLDLPLEESWNSSDMNGDSYYGDENEKKLQDEWVLQHILAALRRLVERARKTMSDGRFNVFDQHRLNSFLPRRTSGKPFFHKLQDNTYKRYIRVVQKLICFVYRRAWARSGPNLPFRLTEAQMTALTETVHSGAALQNTLTDKERDCEYLE
ncbi:hypothetical protein QSH57_004659 [Fusarium oxysporum f. sp. vasinfectum]|nr:hypothetical protein QSH57_004659 [Fusarium oxysporum f. sp. vasinfectum]